MKRGVGSKISKKAWVISVNMGYGHQRAAYPLKDIAYDRIITANDDRLITKKEAKLWKNSRIFYEWISRMTALPIIGKAIFKVYDFLQKIAPFYPFNKDLSKPTPVVFYIKNLIRKGLCKSITDYISKKDFPIVTTHFIPALAADYYGLKNIYCVVTDTDINRVWIAENPKKSRINYLAPTEHTVNRLLQYGVPKERIFLTGFPLPKENLGGEKLNELRKDLIKRLINLDPDKKFIKKYKENIEKYAGKINMNSKAKEPTLTFAIGGAGAQKEIAYEILKSLKNKIIENKISINIVTGTRLELKEYVEKSIKRLGLTNELDKRIKIIYALTKTEYFENFNKTLKNTDILWTKPSELCFYSSLGIPVIISPPVGAHEEYNLEWMNHHRLGIRQENPCFADDWLFYWLSDGRLAEIAWAGFMGTHKHGVYNIERLIFSDNKDVVFKD